MELLGVAPINLGLEDTKPIMTQALGENVCNLLTSLNIHWLNQPFLDLVSDKVTVYLNMFGPLMKNKICSQLNS